MSDHPTADAPSLEDLDFDNLPPEVRAELQAGLIGFLRSIGVTPRFHRATGELMVPLEEMCAALGMSADEARQALDDEPGCLDAGSPGDLVTLQ